MIWRKLGSRTGGHEDLLLKLSRTHVSKLVQCEGHVPAGGKWLTNQNAVIRYPDRKCMLLIEPNIILHQL